MATSQLILAALTLAALVGCALLIRGLRGRRVGNEPRCRRCGYQLTGAVSPACPECGGPIDEEHIVHGTRRQRKPALAIGLTLLVISLGGLGVALYGRATQVNWSPYLPTWLLIQQARLDDVAAINELVRRYRAGEINADRVAQLVPLALTQQGLNPKPPSVQGWTELLADMERAEHLTGTQIEQYHAQIISFELDFRPQVRRGDKLHVACSNWNRGPLQLAGGWVVMKGQLNVGTWSRDYRLIAGGFLAGNYGGGVGYDVDTQFLEPGTYTVELRATVGFNSPEFEREIRLTRPLEVLARDAADTVRMIKDPVVEQALRASISVYASDTTPWGDPVDSTLCCLDIYVQEAVPLDCAFDVFARFGDDETFLFTVTIPKSEEGNTSWAQCFQRSVLSAESFVPVLRSNADVARETLNMFEIWDGELVFPRVTLPPVESTATQPAPNPTTQPDRP